jgi:Family of unknown function (DUF5335)
MPNRQIPREEWSEFLAGFSRRHEGWLVSVRFLSPAVGWMVESHQLALQGVSSDREGSSISVHLGASPGPHVGHVISRPRDVWVEEEEGVEKGVEVESADGTKMLLEFRIAVPPEMVDGLVYAAGGGRA